MPSENVHVKVIGRCRPLTTEEVDKGGKSVVKVTGDKIVVEAAGKEQTYSLDGAYGPDAKNGQIYQEKCDTFVQRALEGYNVTIMAFGATGSGKSYLMNGSDQDTGIAPMVIKQLFHHLRQRNNKEFMVTASFVEILDEKMTDLLNPHNNPMTVRQHVIKGIFVDGLSEMVAGTAEELSQLYEQGRRARRMGATDIKAHRARAHAVFTMTVEQKERQSSKVGVRANITVVELAGCEASDSADPKVLAGTQGGHVPYRESVVTRLLQDSLGGNAMTLMLVTVSLLDKAYQSTQSTLQYGQFAKTVKNHARMNLDDTQDLIAELRQDISKLRDKIASAPEPNRDDVAKMEDLVSDLQLAKKQTWEEKERLSAQHEQQRKIHLANRGILEWVMDSMKKGNREMQENILLLQKERDQLSMQYKEKRRGVDALKDELQQKIKNYTKYTETGKQSESETKRLVTAIHDLKERQKRETESLKKIKDQLRAIQDKQQKERESASAQITAIKGNAEMRQKVEMEERQRLEKDHKIMVEEEVERTRLDVENEMAEIQVREAEGYQYTTKEGAQLEKTLAELKADKPVVAMKIQTLQEEKDHLARELEEVYRMHHEQLELEQLQHYQTFRSYREMFEEQKAAIDQRYRKLLEDCIQDAVFLSSRNSDLTEENQSLKQQVGELKDVVTKQGGKIPSSIDPSI
ncbi:hypothetical protein ACOMHN_018065 [Nucella lapillus]